MRRPQEDYTGARTGWWGCLRRAAWQDGVGIHPQHQLAITAPGRENCGPEWSLDSKPQLPGPVCLPSSFVYPPHLPCPNRAFLPSSQEALTILSISPGKVLGQPGRSLARSCLGQLGVLA